MIKLEQVKKLREETSVSISECQKALQEADGDFDKAKEILRKWGRELANKVSSREAKEGVIESYIHPNKKIGVLLDIRCETDFVARSEEFQALVHELALHIAGMSPCYISEEDIPGEVLKGEKEIYQEQFSKENKPKDVLEKMIEGKLKKYREGISFLSQPFVKDSTKTVKAVLDEQIARLGENIIIKRFVRYKIG